jgi:SnoaL-like domain
MPVDLSPAEAVHTVIRMYRRLDDRDYKGIAALMAPGGVWNRQGTALASEAEILAAMAKRSPTLMIHHLLSNMFADVAADGTAAVTGYMLVVRYDNGTQLTAAAPYTGVENIRTIRAKLTPTEAGWRILNADSDPITFAAP